MLKKIYKKDGLIMIPQKKDSMKLLYSLIKGMTKKEYYQSIGYIY